MGKPTMTPSQAARRLGKSNKTIWRWIGDGRFTPGTVTNHGTAQNPRYRIDRQEIERVEREGFVPMPEPA